MATWCTPADLLAADADIALLAGLAVPTDYPPVPGFLLRLAVAGEDLLEWPDEEQGAVAAVDRLLLACTQAGEQVAGYLAVRWPGGLDPVPGLVRGCAVALAWDDLLGARAAGPDSAYAGIVRKAKAAHATLAGLRDGTLTLGVASAAPSAPAVRFDAGVRVATLDSLRGM